MSEHEKLAGFGSPETITKLDSFDRIKNRRNFEFPEVIIISVQILNEKL